MFGKVAKFYQIWSHWWMGPQEFILFREYSSKGFFIDSGFYYTVSRSVAPPARTTAGSRPGVVMNNQQLEDLNGQLLEAKLTIEGLEKERDFYFGKLRDIEVLCQENDGSDFTQKVLNVLYQTEVSFY